MSPVNGAEVAYTGTSGTCTSSVELINLAIGDLFLDYGEADSAVSSTTPSSAGSSGSSEALSLNQEIMRQASSMRGQWHSPGLSTLGHHGAFDKASTAMVTTARNASTVRHADFAQQFSAAPRVTVSLSDSLQLGTQENVPGFDPSLSQYQSSAPFGLPGAPGLEHHATALRMPKHASTVAVAPGRLPAHDRRWHEASVPLGQTSDTWPEGAQLGHNLPTCHSPKDAFHGPTSQSVDIARGGKDDPLTVLPPPGLSSNVVRDSGASPNVCAGTAAPFKAPTLLSSVAHLGHRTKATLDTFAIHSESEAYADAFGQSSKLMSEAFAIGRKEADHANGLCQPCFYVSKPDGCRHGDACIFCHYCTTRDIRRRKKEKKYALRAAAAAEVEENWKHI